MKVVHICRKLNGGAGLCAARIMDATRKLGIDARAVVAYGNKSEYVDVVEEQIQWLVLPPLKRSQFLMRAHTWLTQNHRINKVSKSVKYRFIFSSPVTHYTNIADHPWVQEADIIHLHYIGEFVDYKSFFKKVKKPFVWTMHDQNPGLGGLDFQKWKDEGSPQLKRLDDKMMQIKKQAYEHIRSMTLVAISSQMEEYAKNNALLKQFPRVKIHNGIDGNAFHPIDKQTARKVLDIPDNRMVFLFSSEYIFDERKGLKMLIDALEHLKISNAILICVGKYHKVPEVSFEIRCEGFVSNNRLQSIYYSAADYFVIPSFLEAFAQTPMEAMACGTPVIAFPCSGATDLINNKNGVVCDGFTADDLAKGIQLIMTQSFNRDEIRNDMISSFSYDMIGKQYVDLYTSLV